MIPQRVALLSFEGPDRYALIGGLGTRVTQLARALGAAGHEVDLFFVGDPHAKPVERTDPGVTLRRWSQWLSTMHPRNAYDGEAAKIYDWEMSLPSWIVDQMLVPAHAAGERVLVICEEWQTANVAIGVDRLARERGVRGALTLMWNANNTYGFEKIHWPTLTRVAAISCVSKYMKFELAQWGVHALVIPNGIDPALLDGADKEQTTALRDAFGPNPTYVKVGRFDPDKNWLQAIDAIAELRASGVKARLIARGGKEPYGDVVMARARERRLDVERLAYEGSDWREFARILSFVDAPVVHVRAFLDESTLYALYAAADATLANSGKEPFGLVGLEVMAAGGIAVCGATGEEYAEPFVNAIVCDTSDGRELATYLKALIDDPALARSLRENGAQTAQRYTWSQALAALDRKIAYVEARTALAVALMARTLLVTGGSRGIGAAIALAAARDGYDVALTYASDRASADAVTTQVAAHGRKAHAIEADVAREADVERAFAEVDARFGALHAVVINAGITGGFTRVDELDVAMLERVLAVNVTGAFVTAREAVRRMSTAHNGPGGAIVAISSRAATLGSPGEYVHYAASKAAVDTLVRGLAKEVSREGVRVNAVQPGLIDTEIHARAGRPDRLERIAPLVPMGRAGTAEEVASSVLWLLSPEASYVTGAILEVGGGR